MGKLDFRDWENCFFVCTVLACVLSLDPFVCPQTTIRQCHNRNIFLNFQETEARTLRNSIVQKVSSNNLMTMTMSVLYVFRTNQQKEVWINMYLWNEIQIFHLISVYVDVKMKWEYFWFPRMNSIWNWVSGRFHVLYLPDLCEKF